MTDITQNTDTTNTPQQPRLISTVFKTYRTNFVLFWRIMMPMIIFGFLFNLVMNLLTTLDPENPWHFDTTRSFFVSETPKSTGVQWGMVFGVYSFTIGWLWLTMCPLILAIVAHHRGIETTSRRVRQQARDAFGTILAGAFLLWLLAIPGMIAFLGLTWKGLDRPNSPYFSSLSLGLFLVVVVVFYFAVKYCLYNQVIIIENQKSSTASLRRSSELVRGVWGRAFGMCLSLLLATWVLTSTILGLTLLIFSLTVPEFAPLREILLSVKFLTLFVGGYARISFENAPNFWTVGITIMVKLLIQACIAPIWAILTTRLYLERLRVQSEHNASSADPTNLQNPVNLGSDNLSLTTDC